MDNPQAGKQVEVVLRYLALKMASRLGQLLAVFSDNRGVSSYLPALASRDYISLPSAVAAPEPFCVIEYIGSWCSLGTGLVLKRKVKNRKQPVATQVLFKVIKSS